jgi:hypothetical protein
VAKLQANADPTKEFFVSVLGKDITLIAAIIDLVDNSVDGARRLRPKVEDRFEGLWVHIDAGPDGFRIRDNCGGIPVETAVNYAFRFGRPSGVKPPDFATGQFGIGLKRALFKLGYHFTVSSSTATSSFTMDVDVRKWVDEPGDWKFDLENVRKGVKISPSRIGTRIEVDSLHPTIAADLTEGETLSQLRTEMRQRHMLSLDRGLVIKINGAELSPYAPLLLQTPRIEPAYERFALNGRGEAPIDVRLLAGVSNGPAREGGWSVFLNDRMVLIADKTDLTGWGAKDEQRLPRFHGQYGRFRGFALLTSPETTRLPWDTTKTGLDVDSPHYRTVESHMIALAEPIIRFLDDVDKETTVVRLGGDPGPLLKALAEEEQSFFSVLGALPKRKRLERPFKRPAAKPQAPPPRTEQSIQFVRPKDEIGRVKTFFQVRSAGQAGENAWEYLLRAEDL